MNTQEMVREFHRKYGHPAPDKPTLEQFRARFRVRLILEEAIEFARAVGVKARAVVWEEWEIVGQSPIVDHVFDSDETGAIDWPEAIDALCDLKYVTEGSAVEMGVDLAPHFAAVHQSNCAKVWADGKPRKPEGWQPPNIAHLLELQKRGELQPEDEVGEYLKAARAVISEKTAEIISLTMKLRQAEERIRELGGCADE